ncbi:sirohydrochlorin cobaltochelatase [Oceanidesulfovibrio marinus]|uniref:Sirohydrochlorin cobaltochelatase n=2 Tax=Oceanidesulfovibrio marinus TaxID=370038 RepID=A0ABX6NBB2_9BACT|nr:sirohydrochlorin cobaltochelatase [Oceanidesulfovibrio marinus]
MMTRSAILLAAFGSSEPQAHRILARFEAKVREAFPGRTVRWAFTSGRIRERLAGEGKKTDSVSKALARVGFERFETVAVQSLHVIPGKEFEDLKRAVRDAEENGPIARTTLGAPLLAGPDDVEAAAAAILRNLPPERSPHEAVLLMGHGTWHQGDAVYDSLAARLAEQDPLVKLGTLEGIDSLEPLLDALRRDTVNTVWLIPLLAVVGAHVQRDMAGDGPNSWKSRIEAAGFACKPVMRGAVENEDLSDIWISHLTTAVSELDSDQASGGQGNTVPLDP